MPSRRGPPASKIVRSSNVRFDEGGLITKPFPDEEDEEDKEDDCDTLNLGKIRGDSSATEQQRISPNNLNTDRQSTVEDDTEESTNESTNEASKGLVNKEDIKQVESDDERQTLPEVTDDVADTGDRGAPDEVTNTRSNRRPRKIHIPKPEFERYTRSKKTKTDSQPHTAFYTAFAASAQPIYNDLETRKETMRRPDWPQWKKAIVKKYQGAAHKKTWKSLKRQRRTKWTEDSTWEAGPKDEERPRQDLEI